MNTTKHRQRELLRRVDVLLLLDISDRTLYRWIKTLGFPHPVRTGPPHGNSACWRRSDIERWLADRERADLGEAR